MKDTDTRGAQTLANFSGDVIALACERCDQYRRTTLLRVFKETTPLPDVPDALANCPKVRSASEPCGAHYPDLEGAAHGRLQAPNERVPLGWSGLGRCGRRRVALLWLSRRP